MTASGPEGKAMRGPHTEPAAAPAGAVPGDEQELRQEIEQTRERLGLTVEQLVAKTDLKARAQAKAAGMTARVKGSTGQARQKAAAAARMTKRKLAARAAPVWHAAPESARRTAITGASVARQRRAPLIAAAAALIAGYMALRWWGKR